MNKSETPAGDSPNTAGQAGRPDLRIAFLLMNHFTLVSVSGLVESLRFAADESFSSRQIFCQWEWMTCDNQPVVASCGMKVTPTIDLDFSQDWDYVVLAGGLLEETRDPPGWLLDEVRTLHQRKIPLITLCSGSFIAGNAGLLNGKRCAIHFTTRDEFRQRFPQSIPVIDQTYINDGGIISSPGGTSIDLAADLIRRHCGIARTQKVLKYLLVQETATTKSSGRKLPVEREQEVYEDEMVQRAILYMRQHLNSFITVQEITEHLQVNSRQLNQAFIRSTGDTVTVSWRNMRLEHARKMMASSSKSIDNIADICGFADASHLILWFRKQYGETPASFRKRRREAERLIKP
ncbi:GlxA family transcriptional regulator [Tatumella sp. UBA2305]|uniref:GlxA family transcriptional regulator n=1 Tax=Tatumella sp. UBA2305 TaxID=1947647 RepID=UPI0025CE70D0|nr:helix-turn-helix domain-containing protein [Tatumella sp. UBA2305]